MFVIVRYRQIDSIHSRNPVTIREFVSDPNRNGIGQSYSRDLSLATVFTSEQSANAYGICGNEHIEPLSGSFRTRFI